MARGRAKMAMAEGVSVWVLEAPRGFGDADYHSHHAIQITISLSGSLSLTARGRTVAAQSLAVAADGLHRFEADGLLAFIFVEPESRSGRALARQLFLDEPLVELGHPSVNELLEPLRETFDAPLGRDALLGAGRAAVEALAPGTEPRLFDPRVQKIIDYAASNLDGPVSLEQAATGIHLSPSRLRHLFVEQTGLAFKTYLLWLRLVKAVQTYSEEGCTLTEAAHVAGFADSAHFSRVFKRTFGLPATTLTRI